MMKTELLADLEAKLQKWLDANADDIGSNEGIYQDDTVCGETARIMARAVEVVIDGMVHQTELIKRLE